ncbi:MULTISPECIES: DUF4287 domain-containing protein [Pseudomonas]|uniref:DUF4287 domain-containing protein n=1 Tax=Pseudomonas TaxID=286 RepID=UPI0020B66A64|nr:DUF4287 domain-containing protein [Pseudomonas sp. SBB6]MCP3748806.1 DUF4287 domain-containing protein [Pseudomonas sp. SBB6]WSE81416.1 DUF4287 domain-containing protein [Pseudomonas donghuensis]
MSEETKVKGPASYFPSIEKKYGQPISHWLNQLGTVNDKKHMEMVNWLKAEHGMGHGHANALVAYFFASAKNT